MDNWHLRRFFAQRAVVFTVVGLCFAAPSPVLALTVDQCRYCDILYSSVNRTTKQEDEFRRICESWFSFKLRCIGVQKIEKPISKRPGTE